MIHDSRSSIMNLSEDESGGRDGTGVACVACEGVFHGAPAGGMIGEKMAKLEGEVLG